MGASAEILCIGTELLLGQIVNTNAAYLAAELAALGIPHHFQTVVGDNPGRIHAALAVACARSGIVLTTGGLGPTPDDLTHAALADFFGAPLFERPEIAERLADLYRSRNRPMPPSSLQQARLPAGATVLPNPTGTAPGLLWEPRPGLVVLTFPGVPSEMRAMWRATAVPFLRSLGWGGEVFTSRTLRFWGVGEAALAEQVRPLLDRTNPTVAPYASRGEVQLRITARAADPAAAQALIAPVEAEIRAIAGEDYFGADDDTLAAVVGARLSALGHTLAVAESCTGGLLGGAITAVAGSSHYFLGGLVAYANDLKRDWLGVDEALMIREGSVSAPVAAAMALGVRERLGSDWGLALTGISGPGGGSEAKPVGLVYLALAGPEAGGVKVVERRFGSHHERELIRHLSAQSALDLLRRRLSNFDRSGIVEKLKR